MVTASNNTGEANECENDGDGVGGFGNDESVCRSKRIRYLEGVQRISLREKIFREIVSNLLVHREYTDARPATLIVYRDRVETTNAAIPHGHGAIRPDRFTPFSKNPTLSKFFMQMGRGEELGSGVLNVNKYLPFYAKGAKPRFVEGDPFVTSIPLPIEGSEKDSGETTQKTAQKEPSTTQKIMDVIRSTPQCSRATIAEAVGITPDGVKYHLRRLQQAGCVRHIGPDKGGHWEVVEPVEGKKG
jgi:ATP-dependent DNA helicase RecG